MARFGLSALTSLLKGIGAPPTGSSSWSRPFGLGWEQPYTVRYASNLDDGPNHGMPLGGFGAGWPEKVEGRPSRTRVLKAARASVKRR